MSKSVPAWGDYKPDIPRAKERGHRCEGSLPEAAYGKAITYCYEDVDGKIWVTNDEYASQVNFCPYCGHQAKVAAIGRLAVNVGRVSGEKQADQNL